MNTIFAKPNLKSLTGLSKQYKKIRKKENMETIAANSCKMGTISRHF
jgi:hypothetical protein